MEQLVEFITSVGFPMAAAIFIYMDSRKDKDRMFDALDKFGDRMENFDRTLQSIDNRLQDLERKGDR